MAHFTQKLGALGYTPMLFASYDVSPHDGRWGRQGGTLPGQVFMHFYGEVWPSRINDPALPDELAWFFAHEAGHMYQHNAWADGDVNAWIHEGGGEAFAALALRAEGAGKVTEAKVASARRECTAAVAQTSVRDAIAAGKFDAAYSCGLLVSLAIGFVPGLALLNDRNPSEPVYIFAVAIWGFGISWIAYVERRLPWPGRAPARARASPPQRAARRAPAR